LQEALEMGAFDVLLKPVTLAHLELAVRAQLLLLHQPALTPQSTQKTSPGTGQLNRGQLIKVLSSQLETGQWLPAAVIENPKLGTVTTVPMVAKTRYADRCLADAAAVLMAKSWIDAH
jgi:hypothetical protein